LPGVAIEIHGFKEKPQRCQMDRALVLVGRSDRCNLRLPESEAEPYVCGIVRTPMGLWAVDLLSSQRIHVNGVSCRHARLEDGDVLQIGNQVIRIMYDGRDTPAHSQSHSGPLYSEAGNEPDKSKLCFFPTTTLDRQVVTPIVALPQEVGRQPIPGRESLVAELSRAPIGQAVLMLVRLIGDIHDDQMEIFRQELREIHRLGQEIRSLQWQLVQSGQADRATVDLTSERSIMAGPELPDSPPERPDPQTVEYLVGQRLAAWEQERQGRLQKVIDLLVNQ
jgi:hypothetical protein